jgi:hypothetical protein
MEELFDRPIHKSENSIEMDLNMPAGCVLDSSGSRYVVVAAFMNTVMDCRISYKAGNFLTT